MIDLLPPSNGTDTSGAAADVIRPHAPLMRQRVLAAIRALGEQGSTMADICAATGIRRSSVCARIDELRRMRAIVDTGQRRRPPTSPVACKVFVAAEHSAGGITSTVPERAP